jgi:hypothetical protein
MIVIPGSDHLRTKSNNVYWRRRDDSELYKEIQGWEIGKVQAEVMNCIRYVPKSQSV